MVIEDLTLEGVGQEARPLPASRLYADQERHLKPLPVAVDIVETRLPQPFELRFDVERAVGRVLILKRLVDRREERDVQSVSRRRHVLEVREHPTRLKHLEDLLVELALSLVLQVMDRHR